MNHPDEAALARALTDVLGFELDEADRDRTAALAAASLIALAPFAEASCFDREPAQFLAILEAEADDWNPADE
ncbi:MAG: hypothetical protein AAFX81_11145 [Pseudomonadota bacterium]